MKSTNKITITSSKELELRRLLFTLSQIKRGHYQQHGFLLTTQKPTHPDTQQTVYLPNNLFNHLNSQFSWSKLDENYWYLQNNYLHQDISAFSFLKSLISEPPQSKLSKNVALQVADFFTRLFSLEKLSVTITSTNIGTLCSYTRLENGQITIFIRQDATEISIAKALCAAIIRQVYPKKKWLEYQNFPQFLVDHTAISQILPPSNQSPSSFDYPQNYEQSLRNYVKIGFPAQPSLTLKDSSIHLSGYGPIDFLSLSEAKILTLLLENKGQIVTFDQIGDYLWSDLDNFSLQAISKTIERIRKKLQLSGLKKKVIFTKRKQGYLLVD